MKEALSHVKEAGSDVKEGFSDAINATHSLLSNPFGTNNNTKGEIENIERKSVKSSILGEAKIQCQKVVSKGI